jgi:AAA ATPase domain
VEGGSFVGRAEQLAELLGLLEAVSAGQGALVLVEGEPGIGKTRLAEEAARRATAAGASVAWAACWDADAAPPFWPWTQLLRAMVAVDPEVGAGLGVASSLLGGRPAGTAGATDPEVARFQLFDTVAGVLRAAAGRRRWLLVIDDLHEADTPTLRLLGFVARQLPTVPAVVLGTVRAEPGADTGLGDIERHGRRHTLGGLSPGEVADLVDRLTGHRPAEEEALVLHRRTGGNPLFAAELVRAGQAHGGRLGEVPLPPSLRRVLARRLARLPDPTRQALTAASVLGNEFRLALLGAVAGAEPDTVLAALDEALAAGVVRKLDAGRYAFTHQLLRDALYEELGITRRVQLHERAGEGLQRLADRGAHVDPAELAHHFVLAAPGGRSREAVGYARAAGEQSMRLLAYEAAARHFEAALATLELTPGSGHRADLLLRLGAARLAAGEPATARQAYMAAADVARAAGHPEQLARAALGLGGGPAGFEVPLFDRAQVGMLEESLAALDPGPSPLRAQVLARLSVARSLDTPVDRRLAVAEEAVAMARRSGDLATLASALAAHCDATAGLQQAGQRQAEAGEIIELATQLGDIPTELLGRRLRLVAHLELADLAAVDVEIAAFARTADAIRQPLYAWYVPLWRGMRALMSGQLEETGRWLARAEALGAQATSANAAMLTGVQRWWLLIETGRSVEQADLLARLADQVEDLGATGAVSLALGDAVAGHKAVARRRLEGLGRNGLAAATPDSEWAALLAQVADLVALLGGSSVAAWAYDALLPHRNRFAVEGIGAYCHGSLERHLGLLAASLGRTQDARAHFAAALELNRQSGAELLVARTLRDAGLALGDRAQLAAAQDAYQALGAPARAAELEAALGGVAGTEPEKALFRLQDGAWSLAWAGRTARVSDSKGMRDLAYLLARPGQEVPALDLAGRAGGDLGQVIDARARAAYKARLAELEATLAEADAAGDAERARRAEAERDALVEQLAAAYGLGGRSRRAGAPAERARSAVTWRIRAALRRVDEVHPQLARHLRRSVRTGTFCSYDPDEPVDWVL